MAHEYTIELRFTIDEESIDNISKALNLSPTRVINSRDRKGHGHAARSSWIYNGQGEVGFQPLWENVDDAFRFILGCFSDKKNEIKALAKDVPGVWWCGHFQAGFNGGPKLSPDLLIEIGEYGVPLYIDNYFSNE